MLPVAILVSIGLLAAAGVWRWSRRPRTRAAARHAPQSAKRFGAVEIRLRGTSCKAARALDGQRFLAHQAPALPLPACTAPRCTCSFAKLSDRRTEDRRLDYEASHASSFLTTERRDRDDRRDAD
jgi:hypothetical protein